jgi:carbon-monoxide dehydrogenase medium subunit
MTVHTDRRTIAGDAFFTDMFETALEEGELITGFSVPKVESASYQKFANPASRYAIVGVMVARVDGSVRVAITGAASCVFRAEAMEAALNERFAPEALDDVAVDAVFNQDIHASADYRAHLCRVMAKRAVAALI